MGNPAGVQRDFEALEKRRFEAMRLLDQGLNQSEVARRVKVVRQTVARWVRECRQQGVEGLRKAGRAGRKPLLNQTDRKRLEALLLEGTEKLTCPRAARLIEREFGIRYHEGHVWKLLVSLGWSPERPVGEAPGQSAEPARTWRKKT